MEVHPEYASQAVAYMEVRDILVLWLCVGLPYNLNRAERHEISALGPFFKVSLSCLPEHYGLAMDSNAIDRKAEQMGKLSIMGGHED